jgi:hypothetical protein
VNAPPRQPPCELDGHREPPHAPSFLEGSL